jgi:hypothetical protein
MDIINFRVAPTGDALEMWVEVPDGPAYEGLNGDGTPNPAGGITIDKIAIQDSDHWMCSYPKKPQFEMTFNPVTPAPGMDLPNEFYNNKKVSRIIPMLDLATLSGTSLCPNLSCNHKFANTGMFFLYVHQVDDGTNPALMDSPCNCNKETTIAVCANL